MIQIRFAANKDKENIISFLKEHWSEKSILVKSEIIFDFQYSGAGKCNFVIAVDDEQDKIYGLKGFFPFNSKDKPDIAAALAVVLQGVRPMLGMEIQRFLEKETNCRWLCSTGLNPNTSVKIYKLFKNTYIVDKLNHYYRIADKSDYKIAVINKKRILPVYDNEYILKRLITMKSLLEDFDVELYQSHKPYKDAKYLEHRYYTHPVYEYNVLGIKATASKKVSSLLIAREIECGGVKVLRIVDFIGQQSDIGKIGNPLEKLIQKLGYEYVDFYCYGIDHKYLSEGGFVLRDTEDDNIIPNYFEPFEQKNIDIYFFSTGDENATVCKADGDQDRPNILPEGF